MPKLWKGALIGLGCVPLLLAAAFVIFFKVIPHRIASRLQPPVLEHTLSDAPDFTFRTLDGSPRRLSDSRGKVIFLDLWGTWCIQCIAEMPTVQQLYEHYQNAPDVQFLIISRLDSPSAVRAYSRRNRFTLPFYVTEDRDVPDSMYLAQYPATFIYARDGSIAGYHAGASDWSTKSVIKFIDQLRARQLQQ
ncbi:MAG TPA: TlpA disulfide reductase family protein [Terriglobales bacterium]|nr:TlpA disulfide reductase family protein [Terriglobales bacterium]